MLVVINAKKRWKVPTFRVKFETDGGNKDY
jgi:hypothetical protein